MAARTSNTCKFLNRTPESIDLQVNPLISNLYYSVKDFQLAAVFIKTADEYSTTQGLFTVFFVWNKSNHGYIHGRKIAEFSIDHGGRPRREFDMVVRVRYQPQWLSAMHMDMTLFSVLYCLQPQEAISDHQFLFFFRLYHSEENKVRLFLTNWLLYFVPVFLNLLLKIQINGFNKSWRYLKRKRHYT